MVAAVVAAGAARRWRGGVGWGPRQRRADDGRRLGPARRRRQLGAEAASAASAGDVCICSAHSLDLHASQRTSPSSLARRANSRGSRRLDAERPSATVGGGSGDL
uniref:Uncharacterized protein n=1 Tax=Oryza glumipatula TaxID=40148 RepID=A0A0E0APA5_9ORYZ